MIKVVIEKDWVWEKNDFHGPYDFLTDKLLDAKMFQYSGKCPIETFQFTEKAFNKVLRDNQMKEMRAKLKLKEKKMTTLKKETNVEKISTQKYKE